MGKEILHPRQANFRDMSLDELLGLKLRLFNSELLKELRQVLLEHVERKENKSRRNKDNSTIRAMCAGEIVEIGGAIRKINTRLKLRRMRRKFRRGFVIVPQPPKFIKSVQTKIRR